MKHVILTFFGIVLLYSFFFNDKKHITSGEKMNYLYENASPTSPSMFLMPDSSFENTRVIMPYEVMPFVSELH